MAIKWRFGKNKEKDAIEEKSEIEVDSLNGASESPEPVREVVPETESFVEPTAETTDGAAETDRTEQVTEEGSSEPLFTSEETPAEEPVQETAVPAQEVAEIPAEKDAPASDLPVSDEAEEPALSPELERTEEYAIEESAQVPEASAEDAAQPSEEPAETPASETPTEGPLPAEAQSEPSPSVEELAESILDDGLGPVAVEPAQTERPAEPAAEQPAEQQPAEGEEPAFVMDDEYMRAFMEEGEMDDYIYGEDFAARQELLDKIADNAETLAEEGTELLEQKEKEKEENKQKEPVYNEKGELLNDEGKAVLKRSFENKLILADTRERRYYNKLKNELLSYEGVKAEMQTATEVFRHGKQVVARITLAGFTRIYFALEPDEFDVERYKQADQSQVDFEDTKMLLRVRDDDEYAVSVELIAIMMGALNINRLEAHIEEDYLPAFPRRARR